MSQRYFFANGNEQRGPYTLEELASFGLRQDTLVWHEGLTEWQRADAVPELLATIQTAQRADPAPGEPAEANPQPQAPLNYLSNQPVPTDGLATASLVLGIVSFPMLCAWLTGVIPAILAIIFGFIARARIKRGERTGAGMALAGLICGFISAGLVLILFLTAFVVGLLRGLK